VSWAFTLSSRNNTITLAEDNTGARCFDPICASERFLARVGFPQITALPYRCRRRLGRSPTQSLERGHEGRPHYERAVPETARLGGQVRQDETPPAAKKLVRARGSETAQLPR
jgi:hypothetical protein